MACSSSAHRPTGRAHTGTSASLEPTKAAPSLVGTPSRGSGPSDWWPSATASSPGRAAARPPSGRVLRRQRGPVLHVLEERLERSLEVVLAHPQPERHVAV